MLSDFAAADVISAYPVSGPQYTRKEVAAMMSPVVKSYFYNITADSLTTCD